MRTTTVVSLLTSMLSLGVFAACGPADSRDGTDGGSGNNSDGGNNGDGGGSQLGSDCSVASQFVYVVDQDNTLSSFAPATKTFTAIGTLNCPASDDTATPFSMGVDRNANAYVLYSDGELFQVTGIAAMQLNCAATTWNAPDDFANFGMGFSTTTAGGTTDQLFVAGGPIPNPDNPIDTSSPSSFRSLDVTSYQAATIGTVQGWPELTGTSAAELWGFFPDATKPRIDQINKTSGAALTSYPLPSLKGQPGAWAFAAYGGDLWVFLALCSDSECDSINDTKVYQVGGPMDASPGSVKSTTPTASGTQIVGAGVSTCAPNVID